MTLLLNISFRFIKTATTMYVLTEKWVWFTTDILKNIYKYFPIFNQQYFVAESVCGNLK